jgi:hypothetical protein
MAGDPVYGDVGETVIVPVLINTVNTIVSFGIDISFPLNLLTYVNATRGPVATDFVFLASEWPGGVVRIGAYGGEIDPGTSGVLATLEFNVAGAGCAALCVEELFEDLAEANGYSGCAYPLGTVSVGDGLQGSSWGRVKSRYE